MPEMWTKSGRPDLRTKEAKRQMLDYIAFKMRQREAREKRAPKGDTRTAADRWKEQRRRGRKPDTTGPVLSPNEIFRALLEQNRGASA